jgi:hypothetical protein
MGLDKLNYLWYNVIMKNNTNMTKDEKNRQEFRDLCHRLLEDSKDGIVVKDYREVEEKKDSA